MPTKRNPKRVKNRWGFILERGTFVGRIDREGGPWRVNGFDTTSDYAKAYGVQAILAPGDSSVGVDDLKPWKVKTNPNKKEGYPIDARELYMYAINHGDLYRQRTTPIIANLKRKIKKGIYDPKLALKLWRYAADDAAQRYTREFIGAGKGYGTFTPATRDMTAALMAKYYADQLFYEQNPARLLRRGKFYVGVPREYTAGFGVDAVTPLPWTVYSGKTPKGYAEYYGIPKAVVETAAFQSWVGKDKKKVFDGNLRQLREFLKAMLKTA